MYIQRELYPTKPLNCEELNRVVDKLISNARKRGREQEPLITALRNSRRLKYYDPPIKEYPIKGKSVVCSCCKSLSIPPNTPETTYRTEVSGCNRCAICQNCRLFIKLTCGLDDFKCITRIEGQTPRGALVPCGIRKNNKIFKLN